MLSIKRLVPIIGFVGLLNACASQTNSSSQAVGNTANCPKQSSPVLIAAPTKDEDFYTRFDYHIHNIAADANTVKFQTYKHDFVFCRGNNTWTVQPGTLPTELQPPRNGTQYDQERYKTIDFNGKTYQYRVIVEATAGPDGQRPEPQKVIFELTEPNNWNAMRGDLDLLSLSGKSTSVKYYSGWVDEALLQPYLAVVPQERPTNPQPNPLDAIAKQLKTP